MIFCNEIIISPLDKLFQSLEVLPRKLNITSYRIIGIFDKYFINSWLQYTVFVPWKEIVIYFNFFLNAQSFKRINFQHKIYLSQTHFHVKPSFIQALFCPSFTGIQRIMKRSNF